MATKTKGIKFDADKERFDLLPPRPLFLLAKLYTKGAKKYADRNWENGMDWNRLFGAIQRHLWKFWNGENIDQETGVPHVINAAWSCFALCEYMFTHKELDNRPKLKQTFEDFQKELQRMIDDEKLNEVDI